MPANSLLSMGERAPRQPVLRGQVLKELASCFAKDEDPQQLLRVMHDRMPPATILQALQENVRSLCTWVALSALIIRTRYWVMQDHAYRTVLERQILLALQRKRTVEDLTRDLHVTTSTLATTKLELDTLKEEWQQMHQRVQEAEQRVAGVEARSKYLNSQAGGAALSRALWLCLTLV